MDLSVAVNSLPKAKGSIPRPIFVQVVSVCDLKGFTKKIYDVDHE